jgi:hypothetical protein
MLRTLFVTNRYALALGLVLAFGGCAETEGGGSGLASRPAAVYSGHIRLSLAHPYDVKNEDYDLLLSVPTDVDSMSVCEVRDDAECKPGSKSYFKTDLVLSTATRKFFKPKVSALLENGLTVEIRSHDKDGNVIDARAIELVDRKAPKTKKPAAGAAKPATDDDAADSDDSAAVDDDSADDAAVDDEDQAGADDESAAPTAAEAKQIVLASCGSGNCHPSYARNLGLLKAQPDAVSRLESGNMPMGTAMDDADRDALIAYLQQ